MVRRCTLADEGIWVELNRAFILYEYDESNVWESPLVRGDLGESFRAVMEDPRSPNLFFLIEEEGVPIGFMNAAGFYSVWSHGMALILDDFFLLEPYRGRGYGRAALVELESLAAGLGYVRLQLHAEDTNPGAISFYQKSGYARQQLNFFCKYL